MISLLSLERLSGSLSMLLLLALLWRGAAGECEMTIQSGGTVSGIVVFCWFVCLFVCFLCGAGLLLLYWFIDC